MGEEEEDEGEEAKASVPTPIDPNKFLFTDVDFGVDLETRIGKTNVNWHIALALAVPLT